VTEQKILLVEDDKTIASGLVFALQQEGYSVTHCCIAREAGELKGDFALAIIDLGLPDGSGFDVAGRLNCPFLFLTAVDDEANTVRGLELGAEDYITKPFRLRELIARIKNIQRRRGGNPSANSEIITIGDIKIKIKSGKVTKGGADIDLTALEYRLLLSFAQNPGRTLTRAQILEKLWDSAGNFVEDNTLTVYIKRLREKLGEGVIETVRGIGYRIVNI